jgi:pimeloyl-ACP methyl ester carboxylesterase
MIFLHGWPGIGLMWRKQIEAFASDGWRCVAPDMRGYGDSSVPTAHEAYAVSEIVEDMVELHDHLGAHPAIWIGHDLGCPVASAVAAHHAARCRALVLVSAPYLPEGFALPKLVALVDRQLYPADQYPDGQWDYYRFYLTHFDQTVSDCDADIPATLASIYRSGSPASAGKVSPSALLTSMEADMVRHTERLQLRPIPRSGRPLISMLCVRRSLHTAFAQPTLGI